jgi:hypothetical protein
MLAPSISKDKQQEEEQRHNNQPKDKREMRRGEAQQPSKRQFNGGVNRRRVEEKKNNQRTKDEATKWDLLGRLTSSAVASNLCISSHPFPIAFAFACTHRCEEAFWPPHQVAPVGGYL